jgi:hypothetical protein
MAKKKQGKDIEVLADVQLLNEIQEAIEEATVEPTEVESKDLESKDLDSKEVEVQVEVVEEPIEEVFGDKDLVTFENNKGELRIGQYGYITKRGYKAIEKYKS